MATGFASALSEGQPAQLDLGEEAVPCLVVGFSGADVVLAPGGAIPEDALAPGNTSYLLIEADGTLQALKARVKPGYTDNPTRAFYNHVWVIGDQAAISVGQQAEVDQLAELAKIGGEE